MFKLSNKFRRRLKKKDKIKNLKVHPTHTTWTVVPKDRCWSDKHSH